jgi:2-furoyl-CoA dehydrogenase FAD binding subunit
MKSASFKYLRPNTLAEALGALHEHGDEIRIIAGGQSLGAMLNMRIVTPSILMDINRIEELRTVGIGAEATATGAMVRQCDALADMRIGATVPLLARALPWVGHYQTRNRGTLGGSISHADPSAEIPLTLATLGGEVELRSKRRVRKVKATEFFRSALVTAREPDELLTTLHWPKSGAAERCAFLEFSVRDGDFAIVAVACVVNTALARIRLGFGGCGEVPQVVELNDIGRLDVARIEAIAQDAPSRLDYRSDLLASADYRKHLAATLARKAITAAMTEGMADA